ncbi:hypothetical protein [Bacteroides heparinolyticus]
MYKETSISSKGRGRIVHKKYKNVASWGESLPEAYDKQAEALYR